MAIFLRNRIPGRTVVLEFQSVWCLDSAYDSTLVSFCICEIRHLLNEGVVIDASIASFFVSRYLKDAVSCVDLSAAEYGAIALAFSKCLDYLSHGSFEYLNNKLRGNCLDNEYNDVKADIGFGCWSMPSVDIDDVGLHVADGSEL